MPSAPSCADQTSGRLCAPAIDQPWKQSRFAITEGRWKLILPYRNLGLELYDLGSDPAEENNVAAQNSERDKGLKKKATDIVLNDRTTPGPAQANDTGHWSSLQWITEAEYNIQQAKVK